MATSQPAVIAFFERYAKAFSAHDVIQLANMFAYPGHVISNADPAILVSVNNREMWLPRLYDLLAMYDGIGFANATVRTLTARNLSDNIVQADINWELRNSKNIHLYDFDTYYTLIRNNTDWQIAQAISPNELLRYKAYLSEHR